MTPTIARDAEKLNQIANHSDVYRWVKGGVEGPLDLAPLIGNENVLPLLGEHGAIVFQRLQPGLYESHTMCLPPGRGPWMIAFTNICLHWIFTKADAIECITRVPHGNAAAKALAKGVGGQYQWTNPTGWVKDGKPIPAEIWSLTIQDWMRVAPNLVERGQWFHERLDEELARHGAQELAHPDDAAHDRYVGAAVDMFLGGQPLKGAVFYNRFAVLGGYHPIEIASFAPLAVDIGTAVIEIRDNDFFIPSMEAAPCQ